MAKTYEVIEGCNCFNLTKKQIKEKYYFNGSLAKVISIEKINNKLFITKKNGDIIVYSNTFGSWGFPTKLK